AAAGGVPPAVRATAAAGAPAGRARLAGKPRRRRACRRHRAPRGVGGRRAADGAGRARGRPALLASVRPGGGSGARESRAPGRGAPRPARARLAADRPLRRPGRQRQVGALGQKADQVANVAWATGLLARYLGDGAVAAPALEAAIGGFTREEAHWERCQALAQRVMLQLERGAPASARADCGALAEVAQK